MIKLALCLRRRPGLSRAEFSEHWVEHPGWTAAPSCVHLVQYHTLVDDPAPAAMGPGRVHDSEPYDGIAMTWWSSADALARGLGEWEGRPREEEAIFVDHSRSAATLVAEHVVIEPSGDVPYVLVEVLRRRPDIDRRRFRELWIEHGRLAFRGHADGLMLGYIQNHGLIGPDLAPLQPLADAGVEVDGWDGIVTAYFPTRAAWKALLATPTVAVDALEDERRFIDHRASIDLLARRRVLREPVR